MFETITKSQEDDLIASVIAGRYSLLLGAGASHDSTNERGRLPLSATLTDELARVTEESPKSSLQKIFSTLTSSEIDAHVTKRLSGSTPGKTYQAIANFNWKKIYTLNIDDALEGVLSSSKRQTPRFIHFLDPFEEFQTNAELPVVYLHGRVSSPELGYVFSRDEYIRIMKGDNPWMVVLSSAIVSDPMIVSGASLDEVDIEYYLSFRSQISSRTDIGPSIFVSSDRGRVVRKLCEDHNFIQFFGYSPDFFEYLSEKIPSPPLVSESVSAGIRDIVPAGADRTAVLRFDADFELVPRLGDGNTASNKFYYGTPPSWSDLSAQLDIPRQETGTLASLATANIGGGRSIISLLGGAGSGKTVILKRVAHNIAATGQCYALWASELSQMSRSTASTLDLIEGRVVLLVDNLADHARAISDVLSLAERDDILIVGAERSYRSDYLDKTFGRSGHEKEYVNGLSKLDSERLIDKLTARALVGSHLAIKRDTGFVNSLRHDPIAVAVCRIMNNFQPLERIIRDLVSSLTDESLHAFATVGIASHCYKGGVRRSVIANQVNAASIQAMLDGKVGLGLRYVDRGKDFVSSENATITDEVLFFLGRHRSDVLIEAFVSLANGLAPRVNRNAIRARAPEARLAGRLFDYDDIVTKFLGDRSEDFYLRSRDSWKWNSRYWEQVALMKLAQFKRAIERDDQLDAIEEALQNARYSVAIELHPFGLTTLGTILMTFSQFSEDLRVVLFDEAFECLCSAIELEKRHGRVTQHPFATLLRGCVEYAALGGTLSASQRQSISEVCDTARSRWADVDEIRDSIEKIERIK